MTNFSRTLVCLIVLLAIPVARGDNGTNGDDAEQIRSSYQQLTDLAKSSQWEKAAGLMTPAASEENCAQMVVLAYGIRNMELPRSIPKFDEAQEQVESVLSDYGLGDLDIKVQMFRFATQPDQEEKTNRQEDAARDLATAKKGLEKVENRWALLGELQKAMAGMPFGHSPLLAGEVLEIEIDNDRAEVKIKPVPPEQQNEGGVQIQIVAPPRVINYQKIDGHWLYAGLNREKTEAALREFEKHIVPGIPGKSDF